MPPQRTQPNGRRTTQVRSAIQWLLALILWNATCQAGPPAADRFADAPEVLEATAEVFHSFHAESMEPGEERLNQPHESLKASVWWKWKAPTDGDVLVELTERTTVPFAFRPPTVLIGAVAGEDLASAQPLESAVLHSLQGFRKTAFSLRLKRDQTIRIRLAADESGPADTYRVRIRMERFPYLLQSPRDVPIRLEDAGLWGRGALMTVRAVDGPGTGSAPSEAGKSLSFQWLKNGEVIPGRTNNFLYYQSAYPVRCDGLYSVVVHGRAGSITSAPVRVELIRGYTPPEMKITRDPRSGLTELRITGTPGTPLILTSSDHPTDWQSGAPYEAYYVCDTYPAGFVLGFNGETITLDTTSSPKRFFTVIVRSHVTNTQVPDFTIDQHMQIIEFRASELLRSLPSVRLPLIFRLENILDANATSWETGGFTPSKTGETYRLQGPPCALATLPEGIGAGNYFPGGTIHGIELPLYGFDFGW